MIENKKPGGITYHNYSHDDEIFGNTSSSDTEFLGNITFIWAPPLTNITCGIITGNIDSITPRLATGSEIGHLRLHNLTRGDYALIQSVGGLTITLDTIPGTWQVGDLITADSVTVISVWPFKYYEVDCSGFLSTNVVAVNLYVTYSDTAANKRLVLHPFEVESTGKRQSYRNNAANIQYNFTTVLPIVDQTFCYTLDANAVGTATIIFRIVGYWE